MPAPESFASIVQQLVNDVRSDLDLSFTAGISTVIGSPQQVDAIDPRNTHYLNFFFYHLAPFEFDASVMPSQPLLLRATCLITPFALQESEEASAGHNDLVLLGETMRIFHQKPVRILSVADHEGVDRAFHLQALFRPLTPEQINQIWTTQGGDVAYHTSVAYEITLAPVLPNRAHVEPPLVGALGMDVHADMDAASAPASGGVHTPAVAATTVDTRSESWVPSICFVHDGACVQSLSFALGGADLGSFARQVWVAGMPGADVRFFWDVWETGIGWQTIDSGQTESIVVSTIDPDRVAGAPLFTLAPPADDGDPVLERAGQAVLYAERTYLRGSDQTPIEVRSNPLVITIYGTGSPP